MEFSANQRLFLATVCAHFHSAAKWPTYGQLDRMLRSHKDLEVEEIGRDLDRFIYDAAHAPPNGWDPDRSVVLSISALYICQVEDICSELADDLDAFMQVVRLCIEKYDAGEDNARITETEVRNRFGLSDLMLRKVYLLITAAGLCGAAACDESNPGEPVNWFFTVFWIIRKYRNVATIQDFVAVRKALVAQAERPYANLPTHSSFEMPQPESDIRLKESRIDAITHMSQPQASSSQDAGLEQNGTESNRHSGHTEEYEYHVAISFAGPQRVLAERLALLVADAGFSVFYDDFYSDTLWGKDLAVFFDDVYRHQARFTVIFFSQSYNEHMWCVHERRSAVARQLLAGDSEYILPIMVESVEVPGIPPTIGYLRLHTSPIERIAEILIKKLRNSTPIVAIGGEAETTCAPLTQSANEASKQMALGVALASTGQFATAAEHFRLVIQADSTHTEARWQLAQMLSASGKYQEALIVLETVLQHMPKSADAWNIKGFILRRLGRYDEALQAYDQALEPDITQGQSSQALVWSNRATALCSLQKYDDALHDADRAIALNNSLPDAWNNKALALIGLGRFKDAIKALTQALELNPYHAGAMNNKGLALRKLGRNGQALKMYRQAVRIDANLTEGWSNIAVLLIALGQYADAEAACDQALRTNDSHVDALRAKAEILVYQRNFTSALSILERVSLVQPRNADNWRRRAQVEQALGRDDLATESTRQAEQLGK